MIRGRIPLSQESAKGAGGKGARVINCHNFLFTPDRETRRIDHTTTEGTAERKMRQFATPAPFAPAPFRLLIGNAWLTVLWGSFWCTQSTVEIPLKRYGLEGFPSHSSDCSGGLFPQYSGVSPLKAKNEGDFYFLRLSLFFEVTFNLEK